MSLDKLQSAIGDAIDEIDQDSGEGGDKKVVLPGQEAVGGDEGGGGDEDEKEKDKSTQDEGGSGTDKETPSPGAADDTETPSETDLLAGFSEAKRKALLKFAPGGKISTQEELAAAETAAYDDYWRNHTRLADLATRDKETPSDREAEPGKGKQEQPAAVPPQLRPYDTKLQAIVQKADDTKQNIAGWQDEIAKDDRAIAVLIRKRNTGAADFNPDDLIEAYNQRDEHSGILDQWRSRWSRLAADFDETKQRRSEVEATIEVRAKLDRQEKEAQDRESAARQHAVDEKITGTAKRIAAEKLKDNTTVRVPDEQMPQFTKYLRFEIEEFFRADPQAKIPDFDVFARRVADNFMGPVREAARRATEKYTKDKIEDAPQVPPGKPKPKPGSQKGGGKSAGIASMSDLQAAIEGHPDW